VSCPGEFRVSWVSAMPSVHWRFALIRLLLVPLLCVPASAAPLPAPGPGSGLGGTGVPMHQRFLGNGASVVTTSEGRVCVASRRIAIESSDYRDPNGTAVPFAGILRSPASSVQAVAGPEAAPGFRVQLKYAVAPEAPLVLMLDGRRIDVRPMLEPSGDSLWIAGGPAADPTADLAADLARAFAADDPVTLEARSAETGRSVTDRLPAPDLAALADCLVQLPETLPEALPEAWHGPGPEAGSAAEAAAAPDLPSDAIGIVFAAEPDPETRATPEDFAACGMADPGLPLHLGRIRATTGFFAQTDKVFVAFDEAGEPAQVYVPGVFDADFEGFEGSARVSRAADGNVPGAENRVAGCLGAAGTGLCRYRDADGSHRLGPCLSDFLPASGELSGPAAGAGPGRPAGRRPRRRLRPHWRRGPFRSRWRCQGAEGRVEAVRAGTIRAAGTPVAAAAIRARPADRMPAAGPVPAAMAAVTAVTEAAVRAAAGMVRVPATPGVALAGVRTETVGTEAIPAAAAVAPVGTGPAAGMAGTVPAVRGVTETAARVEARVETRADPEAAPAAMAMAAAPGGTAAGRAAAVARGAAAVARCPRSRCRRRRCCCSPRSRGWPGCADGPGAEALAEARDTGRGRAGWCPQRDSNSRPTDYKSVALPAEL
jgi:hypothetical protein